MKYHALFVIFEKAAKFAICRLLQIIDGALRVNSPVNEIFYQFLTVKLLTFCLASGDLCRLLIYFENSLDPDQD